MLYVVSKEIFINTEDQPHIQRAVAAQAQEGLEDLSHTEDQEGWW